MICSRWNRNRVSTWMVVTALGIFGCSWSEGQAPTSSGGKGSLASSSKSYDPLRVAAGQKVETLVFEIDGTAGSSSGRFQKNSVKEPRKIPLKAYLPQESSPLPIVLFSHGLGGSREGFPHGGEHWAKRGYVAVFLQHPGSDDRVWRDTGIGQKMSAMREAASAENLLLRIDDVKTVIDFLEQIKSGVKKGDIADQLKPRIDTNRIGMSGHSFGAITTQMVSGQSPALPSQTPNDPRIKAAVILSPSPPKIGRPERYFGKVTTPWLLMTGTQDVSPIGDISAASRLEVFPALAPGDKYELVLEGGTHAFPMERPSGRNDGESATPHVQAVLGVSTAFWDAYLRDDAQAKEWLQGGGVRSILNPKDRWQTK